MGAERLPPGDPPPPPVRIATGHKCRGFGARRGECGALTENRARFCDECVKLRQKHKLRLWERGVQVPKT